MDKSRVKIRVFLLLGAVAFSSGKWTRTRLAEWEKIANYAHEPVL